MSTRKNNYTTIPNLLSVLRGFTALVMIWYAYTNPYVRLSEYLEVATVVATTMFVTDFLDGWIARRWPSQRSEFGAMIDPVTDKLAVVAFLFYLFESRVLQYEFDLLGIMISLIILREVMVSVLRMCVGHGNVPVVNGGKWKTLIQMLALIAIGFAPAAGVALWWAASILLTVATILTVITGILYFWRYFCTEAHAS